MLVELNNRVSDLEYDSSVLAIYSIKGGGRKGMRRVQSDVSFHPVMDVSDIIVWNINAVIACTRTL